jgi:hypothetical protein
MIERRPFSELLERHASRAEFQEWFRAFSEPRGLSPAAWMELVPPVAQAVIDLHWMPESDRGMVTRCILDFVQRAFTVWTPADPGAAREVVEDFVCWVESLSDDAVVRFCWDLLSYDRTHTPDPVWWLKRSGRLSGAISYDSLVLAVALADEVDAMYWWPKERWNVVNWDSCSAPYLELLSHTSYLVRAAASYAVGRVYFGVQTKTEGRQGPPLSGVLTMIQERESITPGIAGPFLDGTNWSFAPEEWDHFGGGIDMKSWFIETLRESGLEPQVPHIQTLEFYAHELFASDANAIREFLRMGRRDLAVMTATQEPNAIPALLPVLTEMAASSDPVVAAAIREYLSSESHHAGVRHLHKSEKNSGE